MNIFVTSYDYRQCALEHCLVHRNKMIIEYAQLMSSAHHCWGTWQAGMCKPTHVNHPSSIWTRQSINNYSWLYSLWHELNKLYIQYTGKMHACFERRHVLKQGIITQPAAWFHTGMLAMPDQYKQESIIGSYQDYLRAKFNEWRQREKPIKVYFHDVAPAWL